MKIVSRRGIETARRISSLDNPIYETEGASFLKIPFPGCTMEEFIPDCTEGEYVPQFGRLGRNGDGFGVFAPYCGRYQGAEYIDHQVLGKTLAVKLSVEHGMSMPPFEPLKSDAPESDEVIRAAKRSGIIDETDGRPLYQKLIEIRDNKPDIIFADCIEDECCETASIALLLEHGEQIAKGLELAAVAAGVWKYFIAASKIKGHFKAIRQKYLNAEVIFTEGKYPVRSAVRNFYSKKKVAFLGANACLQLCCAVEMGSCQTTCIVTVEGDCVKHPSNLEVAVGTPISHLIEICVLSSEPKCIIAGDIINGCAVTDPMTPVVPSMKCIVAMENPPEIKETSCTKCGRCANNCPQNLLPYRLTDAVNSGNEKLADELQITKCDGCGACSFSCPSGINIRAIIKGADMDIANQDAELFEAKPALLPEKTETGKEKEGLAASSLPEPSEAPAQESDTGETDRKSQIIGLEVLSAINQSESEKEQNQIPYNPQSSYVYTPLHDDGIEGLIQSSDSSDTTVSLNEEYKIKDYSEYLDIDFSIFDTSGSHDVSAYDGSEQDRSAEETMTAEDNAEHVSGYTDELPSIVRRESDGDAAGNIDETVHDEPEKAEKDVEPDGVKKKLQRLFRRRSGRRGYEQATDGAEKTTSPESDLNPEEQPNGEANEDGIVFDLSGFRVAGVSDRAESPDGQGFLLNIDTITRKLSDINHEEEPDGISSEAADLYAADPSDDQKRGQPADAQNEMPPEASVDTLLYSEAGQMSTDTEPGKQMTYAQTNGYLYEDESNTQTAADSDDSSDEFDFDAFMSSINDDIEKTNRTLEQIRDLLGPEFDDTGEDKAYPPESKADSDGSESRSEDVSSGHNEKRDSASDQKSSRAIYDFSAGESDDLNDLMSVFDLLDRK
ncbi:MAG: 4Fe-4S dicluster domain-containing protein [Clostridia bacterium]|nr:4Fe-4S dicluster domain-containing protein [Clostridia bacterium]